MRFNTPMERAIGGFFHVDSPFIRTCLTLTAISIYAPSARSQYFALNHPIAMQDASLRLQAEDDQVSNYRACQAEFVDSSGVFNAVIAYPLHRISDDRKKAFQYPRPCAIPGSSAYTFVAPAATNPQTSTYKNFPELSQTFRIYDYQAGFNIDAANQNKGRSGAFVDVLRLYQGGQGDLVGRSFFGSVYSTKVNAEHFLAEPSIAVENGNIGAEKSANGAYLQHSEYIFGDGGAAVSVIDRVRNYVRTNGGAALGQTWIHDRPQSTGPIPIDGFYVPYGKAKRGMDTTGAELGTEGAALVLAPGQRIYFGGISKPDLIGARFTATDVGVSSIYLNQRDNSIHISPGIAHRVVIDDLPSFSDDLPQGTLYVDKDRFLKVR